jgi:hypothetical protein
MDGASFLTIENGNVLPSWSSRVTLVKDIYFVIAVKKMNLAGKHIVYVMCSDDAHVGMMWEGELQGA